MHNYASFSNSVRIRSIAWAALAFRVVAILGLGVIGSAAPVLAECNPVHVAIIAGADDDHPTGTHEYLRSAELLAELLDALDLAGVELNASVHPDGWPADESVLAEADTVVLISGGRDHRSLRAAPHPLLEGGRMDRLQREIDRGCGLVVIHWGLFVPSDTHGDRFLDWIGGYFDYQTGDSPEGWFSRIGHGDYRVSVADDQHPVMRGVSDFEQTEEFYYRMRFRENDPRRVTLATISPADGEPEEAVLWAVDREDGGRGVGYTGGHYLENFRDPALQRVLLNAVVWSAHGQVPEGGVQLPAEAHADLTGHYPHGVLDVAALPLTVPADPAYSQPPLTVEAWVRLDPNSRGQFNIITSNQDKASADHWELYSYAGSGTLSAYLPGAQPAEVVSAVDVVTGRWHHVAMTYAADEIVLYVDGHEAKRQAITRPAVDASSTGPLYLGQAMHGDTVIDCAGEVASVRLTAGIHPPAASPPAVFEAGTQTLGLWRRADESQRASLPGIGAWDHSARANHGRESDPPPAPFMPGRHDQALNTSVLPLLVPGRDDYANPPLTVEAWIALQSSDGHNVIVSNEDRTSGGHWELFSQAKSGRLAVYMPGYTPSVVVSEADVVTGGWRYVAMTLDAGEVVLYADGQEVARQPIERDPSVVHIRGTLYLGQGINGADRMGCDGLIDEVRLSRGLRAIPNEPPDRFVVENDTAGLWRFPGNAGGAQLTNILARDISPAGNHGFSIPGAEWTPPGGTGYEKEAWETETDTHWIDSRINLMDTGRFYSASFDTPQVPGTSRTYKGIAVRLGDDQSASILFDTLLMRPTLAWTGDYIEHSPIRFAILNPPVPAGQPDYYNLNRIGWAPDGDFADPRPNPYGPLPEGYPRYQGLYTHNDRVVFRYTIGEADILESYWVEGKAENPAFTRTIEFEALPSPQLVDVFATDGGEAQPERVGDWAAMVLRKDGQITAALIVPDEDGRPYAWAEPSAAAASIQLPAGEAGRVKLIIWHGPADAWETARASLAASSRPEPLTPLTQPGETRWAQTITAPGSRAPDDSAFVVDTLPVPFENPYHALMFTADLGLLPNGDLAVCTVHGDVWVVSGVDSDLNSVTWKRFATGLYQPLGLEVVDGDIYVLGRDQITILRDRDHNGEADFYENFTNALENPGDGHAYAMCLERDSQGNFFFMNSGNKSTRHGGSIIRVSPDGTTMQRFAEGFRHPNGMGVGPDDVPTVGDNEGNWVPATPIDRIEQGRFYGYVPAYRGSADPADARTMPMLWLPRTADNAAGSQDWVPQDTWGPLAGRMLHLTWGRTGMFLISQETVNGTRQGAAAPFPLRFRSGSMRSQFNTNDQSLYVTGLDGWLTAAQEDGMLQRVRYTGQPANMVLQVHAHTNGLHLVFSDPIHPNQDITPDTFTVQRWNYRWAETYGSHHYSVQHPGERGEDTMPVLAVHLSPDRREAFLTLDDMQPVMQMRTTHTLRGANNKPIAGPIYNTIHQLADPYQP